MPPHTAPPNNDDDAEPQLQNSEQDDDDSFSTESDHSPPPPRKRRKPSPVATDCKSSVNVPASVRRRVILAADDKCWLCGYYGKHVAHVVARADHTLFRDYQRRGLISMPNIHNISNLIYLCPSCHNGFDERTPVWTFLPQDLTTLITVEENFQSARREAALAGQVLARQPPEPQNLAYVRYQVREGHLNPSPFINTPVKHWLGCPVATILRSAGVVAGHERLDPVSQGGIPDEVALQLQRLLFLYGTPQPKVHATPDNGHPESSLIRYPNPSHPPPPAPPSQDDTGIPRKRHSKSSGSEPPRQNTPPNSHVHQKSTKYLPPSPHDLSKPEPRRKETNYIYGPNMTSNSMVNWAITTRQNARCNG